MFECQPELCCEPNCGKKAYYGFHNCQPEWCIGHAPEGTYNRNADWCLEKGCSRIATHGRDGLFCRCEQHQQAGDEKLRDPGKPLGPIESRAKYLLVSMKAVYRRQIVAFKGKKPVFEKKLFFEPPTSKPENCDTESYTDSDDEEEDIYEPGMNSDDEGFVVTDSEARKRKRSPEPEEPEPALKKKKGLQRQIYTCVRNINDMVAHRKFDANNTVCQHALKCLQAAEKFFTAIKVNQEANQLINFAD
ncbi:MAG: hypothetical protein CMP20_09375 [Rickettsiales bacterium]|nr:hypothetical protein [Rickettsiales bacterium]